MILQRKKEHLLTSSGLLITRNSYNYEYNNSLSGTTICPKGLERYWELLKTTLAFPVLFQLGSPQINTHNNSTSQVFANQSQPVGPISTKDNCFVIQTHQIFPCDWQCVSRYTDHPFTDRMSNICIQICTIPNNFCFEFRPINLQQSLQSAYNHWIWIILIST